MLRSTNYNRSDFVKDNISLMAFHSSISQQDTIGSDSRLAVLMLQFGTFYISHGSHELA